MSEWGKAYGSGKGNDYGSGKYLHYGNALDHGKYGGGGKGWQQHTKGCKDDGEPQHLGERVSRITTRYQFPKNILRASVDPKGSAFVKGDKETAQKISDDYFLGERNLKRNLLNSNSLHLGRRPGI